MKVFRTLGIVLLALLICSGIAIAQEPFSAGQWTKISATPQSGIGHTLLLTDGSVLAINSACNVTGNWYRLVPDSTGSYINGTWKSGGTLPAGYNPLYFASAVLPNGNVIIVGGTSAISTAEQKAQQAAQPAEGSSCSNPPGGGKGVIAIEGPTAPNPGKAECIPQ